MEAGNRGKKVLLEERGEGQREGGRKGGVERGREEWGREEKKKRENRKRPRIKYIQPTKASLLWISFLQANPPPKVHATAQMPGSCASTDRSVHLQGQRPHESVTPKDPALNTSALGTKPLMLAFW